MVMSSAPPLPMLIVRVRICVARGSGSGSYSGSGSGSGSRVYELRGGASSGIVGFAYDGRFVRGLPKREGPGSKLFGRPMPLGDVGVAFETLGAGEAERGPADTGDVGRVNRDDGGFEGLGALAMLPRRVRTDGPKEGDADRGMPQAPASLEIFGFGAASGSGFSWLLGPATRLRRSSSCVLSLGDKGPTYCQTFSPTRA